MLSKLETSLACGAKAIHAVTPGLGGLSVLDTHET